MRNRTEIAYPRAPCAFVEFQWKSNQSNVFYGRTTFIVKNITSSSPFSYSVANRRTGYKIIIKKKIIIFDPVIAEFHYTVKKKNATYTRDGLKLHSEAINRHQTAAECNGLNHKFSSSFPVCISRISVQNNGYAELFMCTRRYIIIIIVCTGISATLLQFFLYTNPLCIQSVTSHLSGSHHNPHVVSSAFLCTSFLVKAILTFYGASLLVSRALDHSRAVVASHNSLLRSFSEILLFFPPDGINLTSLRRTQRFLQ